MNRTAWMALLALIASNLGELAVAQQPEAKSFSKDQLEQLVAPIALYADNLVTSVLMAATYPLEIVEADRWLDSHKDLKGDALQTALKDEEWDPSVKSIVTVPEVLKRMSQNLDWTRDLGDAFLGQQAEVMDAVQRMRGKANEAGNLKSSEQQNVTVNQDQTIIIESTTPEVCYVPEYSTVVYGGGWSYPEYYYPSMYPVGWGALTFGAGLLVGGALWGNANWGWGHGHCDINVNNYNNFNNRVNNNWQNSSNRNWNHNVDHRKGVGYRDNKMAQKYGGKGGSNRVSNPRRGQASQLPANRPGAGGAGQRPGAGAGAGQRPGAGAGAGQRPGAGAGGGQRPSGGAGGGQRPAQQPSGGANRPSQRPSGGYSGASQPRGDRAASNRGNASRGRSSGGGGGRGGGGRGGGGRGGRR